MTGTYLELSTSTGNPFTSWPPNESVEEIRKVWDEGRLYPNGAYADFYTRVLANPSHSYVYSEQTQPNGDAWRIVDNKTLGIKILIEPATGSLYHIMDDYYNKLKVSSC